MRPQLYFYLAIREVHIGMVSLLFCDLPYFVDKVERLTKIREKKGLLQMMFFDDIPMRG